MYNTEYFPEPYAFNFSDQLVKIPGLDGKGKMGKSEGEANAVFISDSPEVIRKKVMRAVTDSGPMENNSAKPEVIKNLFDLMKVVSKFDTYTYFEDLYNNCQIRYGDLKKQLAEDMIVATEPVREKINELAANTTYLREVSRYGADKANTSALKTVKEVREFIGFKSF
jgi:tryptophanyl-tRNA synthetase